MLSQGYAFQFLSLSIEYSLISILMSSILYPSRRIKVCSRYSFLRFQAPECKIELASYIASRNARPEWTAPAKLIYKTPADRPYDVAVLKADFNCKQTLMKAIKLADSSAVNGKRCYDEFLGR